MQFAERNQKFAVCKIFIFSMQNLMPFFSSYFFLILQGIVLQAEDQSLANKKMKTQ